MIRQRIRDCALFLPIISQRTQARTEGYFRLEWSLADERTHLMGRNRPFVKNGYPVAAMITHTSKGTGLW
jgi:hypothetical protein